MNYQEASFWDAALQFQTKEDNIAFDLPWLRRLTGIGLWSGHFVSHFFCLIFSLCLSRAQLCMRRAKGSQSPLSHALISLHHWGKQPGGVVAAEKKVLPGPKSPCVIVVVIDPVHHGWSPDNYLLSERDSGSTARKNIRLIVQNVTREKVD